MLLAFILTVPYHHRKAHLSSKKLLEQCQKLDKLWGHIFTVTLDLSSENNWYNKLVDIIDKQQAAPIWMSETKVSPKCYAITIITYMVWG